jgi:hypothetical protein
VFDGAADGAGGVVDESHCVIRGFVGGEGWVLEIRNYLEFWGRWVVAVF